ncbi:hypothetical protein DVUA0141 (plasmid) [Nitratidesulfovibrio vulgaris str. Hildenborough]|uniref:Uncharacterized protein n=1 Tax=Nitratidesulfovibrio vulgaris (strain ATCC 29579 / DSM 644 / CCUG 34227 / NCIMB 8303 / VKM B-1760 / Hildenborough) TaxID=882 RepID=Q72WE8_NITV2|nr:hypothetical protein DVUA0141 [Nitratidesulfovibrio vulgaris str. Hildenborough]
MLPCTCFHGQTDSHGWIKEVREKVLNTAIMEYKTTSIAPQGIHHASGMQRCLSLVHHHVEPLYVMLSFGFALKCKAVW